jgi:hypothetical protein
VLSDIFPDPAIKHLHIVNKCPAIGERKRLPDSGEPDDCHLESPSSRVRSAPPSAYSIAKGREESAARYPQKVPSEKGKLKNFAADQRRAVAGISNSLRMTMPVQ